MINHIGLVPQGAEGYQIAQSLAPNQQTLIIAKDIHAAKRLESELQMLRPDCKIVLFPDREILPYDAFSPPADLVSKRLSVLADLVNGQPLCLIVAVQTFMHYLPPTSWLAGEQFQFEVGHKLNIATFIERLGKAGYVRTQTVEQPREFASRGFLFDVFPMGQHLPFRIEFFDDEIENIRIFNPDTQRTLEHVTKIDLLPAHEFTLTADAIRHFRNQYIDHFEVDSRSNIYQSVSDGKPFMGIEAFIPWLHPNGCESLLNYLQPTAHHIICEGVWLGAKRFYKDCQDRYNNRRSLAQPSLAPETLFFEPKLLKATLTERSHTSLHTARQTIAQGTVNAPLRPIGANAINGIQTLINLSDLKAQNIICCLESRRSLEHCQRAFGQLGVVSQQVERWQDAILMNVEKQGVSLMIAPFLRGFFDKDQSRLVLTQFELFGDEAMVEPKHVNMQRRVHHDFQTALHNLSQLELGAPVVHADQGVGRFNGLQTLDINGQMQDFICLLYADNDKFYLPIHDLDLLSPYVGNSDLAPLHKLGATRWNKEKEKAQKKAEDVAAQLLEVYAKREAREGLGIEVTDDYLRFSDEFSFVETPDQAQTIQAVIDDLAQIKSMDRLVCGDVGFGKTEVAIRAAFIAAMAGKQVAILVPTTLLANQHYQNISDRFSHWPIRVGLVSRLQSNATNKKTLEALANNQLEVLIGTHRLLQPDVMFCQLGLVIIDEEHRFGVKQKERFKAMRAEVNILTMTATPIPRTLNMAFSKLRDISIIASPPPNRVAIQTFVREWDQALIKEAISREIYRGGQVFFIHNDISSIERMRRTLLELMPDLDVGIAHGQMPEKEMEVVMEAFYHQHQQVLLCTTIVENGIDIPNANTIIINRADKFGLAQLHQLRGRVGRSDHQAYAYLFVPSLSLLKGDARKRLDTIAKAQDLGSGFQLAIQDLEIRGAGELLGDQQKGHIQLIGFNLYMEMLERAINNMSDQDLQSDAPVQAKPLELNLGVNALIPADYIDDVPTRLNLYQRINQTHGTDQLLDIRHELIDRYGRLPDECEHLFQTHLLKHLARPIGLEKIYANDQQLQLQFKTDAPINTSVLIRQIQQNPEHWRLRNATTLVIQQSSDTFEQRYHQLTEIINMLSPEG